MTVRNNLSTRIKKVLEDKSYRKKYRYYYALTFLIPIMVILLANILSQNIVKAQVIQSNERL